MLGLMMDTPLRISSIATHVESFHGDREIVSVTLDNPAHRTCWREVINRSRQLANALGKFGLKSGDRVATIAWNDYRHIECYYGISGAGYVCHTINPRLFPDQLVYIINHAEDRWVCLDAIFVPLVEKIANQLSGVDGFIVLTDEAHMPDTALPNAHCYETLIAGESSDYVWPEVDERG